LDIEMAKAKPSTDNKLVARHVATAFGGSPQVAEYHHDSLPLAVDLLWCENRPCDGVTAYSTIRLSDHKMFTDTGAEFPTRLELAAACRTEFTQFSNVLASAAFCIIRTKELYAPGSVLRGYVREYFTNSPVPHLYLTAPYLWEGTLPTLNCRTKTVSWLMAVPISDQEFDYLESHDDLALESLLERNETDIFDLNRRSAI
jgi:hypothetical protein